MDISFNTLGVNRTMTAEKSETNEFNHDVNVVDLAKYPRTCYPQGRGWAIEMADQYDLAADDADLAFLLQPPRDLSERGTTIKRGWRWDRVGVRVATLLYAFLFGMALATDYNLPEVMLIGVALACAWVVVETL